VRKARFPREAIPGSTVAVQLVTYVAVLALLVADHRRGSGHVTPALLLLRYSVVLLFFSSSGAH